MTALAAPRNTFQMDAGPVPALLGPIGVAANAVIYQGAIICVNSSGYLVNGSTATGLVALGMCNCYPEASVQSLNNTGGGNGAIVGAGTPGTFAWNNSSGGDAIANTNIGADCWIVDDQTVALTDGNGTRSFAGRVMFVDQVTGQVYVQMAPWLRQAGAGAYPRFTVAFPVPALSAIATGVIAQFTPQWPGRILASSFTVETGHHWGEDSDRDPEDRRHRRHGRRGYGDLRARHPDRRRDCGRRDHGRQHLRRGSGDHARRERGHHLHRRRRHLLPAIRVVTPRSL